MPHFAWSFSALYLSGAERGALEEKRIVPSRFEKRMTNLGLKNKEKIPANAVILFSIFA